MKFAAQVYPGEDGSHSLFIAVPASAWPALRSLLDRSALKHSGYLSCSFMPPFRPATRGPKKQRPEDKGYQFSHAWGHAGQIAEMIGEDPRDVLYEACIASPQYPTRMDAFGNIKAKRWHLASVEEAAIVIEKLHQIAAEWDPPIILIESRWEKKATQEVIYEEAVK